MLTRNRCVRRALKASLITAILAGIAATWLLLPLGTGAVVKALTVLAAASLCQVAIFLASTRKRHQAIASLSERLDAALSRERDLDFHDMSEGELSVLSSEIDKVITRLNLTVDELEREKLSLSDSLANISHQLKTPLTSIALSTELLKSTLIQTQADPSAIDRVRTIQGLQEHVENLVAALLKLARIDAGVVKLAHVPVNAGRLVRRAYEGLAIAYDIKDVGCMIEADPATQFEGDPNWSTEALANVLKNCLEHTPSGGTVRITAREDAIACRITVSDSGPGIPEQDLPHIFERFYRGSGADDTRGSEVNPTGVGIGLSLAKSLVKSQGGTIKASNIPAPDGSVAGARFEFIFFKNPV